MEDLEQRKWYGWMRKKIRNVSYSDRWWANYFWENISLFWKWFFENYGPHSDNQAEFRWICIHFVPIFKCLRQHLPAIWYHKWKGKDLLVAHLVFFGYQANKYLPGEPTGPALTILPIYRRIRSMTSCRRQRPLWTMLFRGYWVSGWPLIVFGYHANNRKSIVPALTIILKHIRNVVDIKQAVHLLN